MLTVKRDLRHESVVLRSFGGLLTDVGKVVPDGIICVFSDYSNIKLVLDKWYSMGVIDRLLEQKLLFIETPSVAESMEVIFSLCRHLNCIINLAGLEGEEYYLLLHMAYYLMLYIAIVHLVGA